MFLGDSSEAEFVGFVDEEDSSDFGPESSSDDDDFDRLSAADATFGSLDGLQVQQGNRFPCYQ